MTRRFAGHRTLILRSFVNVARQRGVVRTARLALSELLFDLVHGTDTSLEYAESRPQEGRLYPSHAGCNPVIFRELIANVPIRKETGGFLDLGSGKGRALLLAESCGFRSIIGVEAVPRLCAIAEQNIANSSRRSRKADFTVSCGDAAGFTIPVDVTVIFLYNPFGPDIVDRVIDRVLESVARSPREIFVVYQNARFLDHFVARGFTLHYRQGVDGAVLVLK